MSIFIIYFPSGTQFTWDHMTSLPRYLQWNPIYPGTYDQSSKITGNLVYHLLILLYPFYFCSGCRYHFTTDTHMQKYIKNKQIQINHIRFSFCTTTVSLRFGSFEFSKLKTAKQFLSSLNKHFSVVLLTSLIFRLHWSHTSFFPSLNT